MIVSLRSAAIFATALLALAPKQSPKTVSLLIEPAELAQHLKDPSLVLLYVGPDSDYAAGHIPGARYIVFNKDLALDHTPDSLVLELPTEADLRARLERLGIGDNSKVVVVPGVDWASPSTRVMWTLQAAGLGAQSRLLDGGTVAWKRAGLPLTTAAPAPATPGHLTRKQDRTIVVDHSWVEAHEHATGVRIIDARAPMFYEGPGMPEHNAPGGHVPGAKNIPFNTLINDDVQFLPIDDLRKAFDAAGVASTDTVTAYCHVGMQATVVIFAARLLGHPVRLYDGSMNDWSQRKLPLENDVKKTPNGPHGSGR